MENLVLLGELSFSFWVSSTHDLYTVSAQFWKIVDRDREWDNLHLCIHVHSQGY